MIIKLKSGEIVTLKNVDFDTVAKNIDEYTGNPIFLTFNESGYLFVISNIEYIARIKEATNDK